MDLLIFIILISGVTALTIWFSKKIYQVSRKAIFIPSLIMIGLTFISGTLALVIDNEIALIYAVAVFVFAPTGLITLVYALNYYYQNKNT